MNLLSRFNAAIQEFTGKLAKPGSSPAENPSQIALVLTELSPAIELATQEFAAIRLGQTAVPNAAVFLLASESTLVRSMLVFEPEFKTFFRRDGLDLNLPDVIFELADQTREENIETHDFSYNTHEEVVEAYLQWFAWAVALLRKERADDKTNDTAA